MSGFAPFGTSWLDSPGLCCRELKPGVSRENHKLTDHIDYSEEAIVEDTQSKEVQHEEQNFSSDRSPSRGVL